MGQIVSASAVSHAPGLIGLFDGAPEESKEVVRTCFKRIKQDLEESRPDAVIIFANDHLANSRPRAYPDFLIGMADEHVGPDEWFKPWLGCRDYTVAGNPQVAQALLNGMGRRGIRMFAQRENLRFDDNISIPAVWTDLDQLGTTLVPVMQNVTVPPMPGPEEVYRIGVALAEIIREDLPDDYRVAIMGTGGLSHEPGGKRYYYIDEEFDRWFLDLLVAQDHERILKEVTMERMEAAGIGGTTELLSWLLVLGAVGQVPCENLGYTAYTNWKSGVGGVLWKVSDRAEAVA
ncbi:extradiol dioxygenase [Micromonospora sonneratiae]|uniref:Extradiol ring-cleavage dioxygenase class III enzyme subunit B domain-containing protein n=1 Tax=Micromonospora sonneratiae TaxID=1184706 RepID=A0ABW3YBX1_9ACTN